MISTPFYRNLVSSNPIRHQGTISNYTDYTIFSLRCWVHLWIKKKIGIQVEIDFQDRERDGKLYIELVIKHEGQLLNLSPDFLNFLEDNINQLAESKINWVPVYSAEYETYTEDGYKIPKIWVSQLLNFMEFHDSYRPYVSEYGLLINLSTLSDYKSLLSQLTLNVKNTLVKLYNSGIVYRPSEDLINDWHLTQVEGSQALLYKADWDSNGIMYPYKYKTDFLLSRASNRVINLPLKLSLYDKHLLSELLEKKGLLMDDFMFDSAGVQVQVEGYKEALELSRIIYNYYNNRRLDFDIDIGVMYIKSPNEIKDIIKDGTSGSATVRESIIYKIDDTERPYVVSILGT